MGALRDILGNLASRFSELSMGRKIVAGLVGAGLVATLAVFSFLGRQGDSSVLFSNLSMGDSMELKSHLDRLGVPYHVSQKGSLIRVPSKDVYALRMQLSDEGLPRHHGAGFDIFNHPSLATTDFAQKVQYLEALQTELDRTIEEMHPIALARVSIVLPTHSVFLREKNGAHASVLVRLKQGESLSKGQVNGIVHLVSNAVPGLVSKHVTVVDTDGEILNVKRPSLIPGELTSAQLAYQEHVQKQFQGQLQTMLDKVLGPDQSVVRVTAELNFRRVEKTSQNYDPNGRVLKDREKIRQESRGSRILPVGVPGLLSNVPGATGKVSSPPLGPQNGSETSFKKKKEIDHYDVSETTQHVMEPVGTIKRVSVSVLVNQRLVSVSGTKGKKTVYEPRSAQEIQDFTHIVQNAMGFDPARGDQVVVLSVPFAENASGVVKNPDHNLESSIAPFVPLLEIFLGGVLLLLFGILVLRPLLKSMTQWKPAMPTLQMAEGPPQEGAEGTAKPSSREEVARMTQEDPGQAAQVIRSWLKEK
jgi:flagellar M-ring protein FliF